MSMDTQPIKRTGAPKAPGASRGPSAPSPMHRMDNPFLNEEEFVLPHIPDDDEWHYCWIRYRIGRDDDLKNMTRYLTGKLPFELVTEEMLPDVVKTQFSHLKISTGSQSGKIGIGDIKLVKLLAYPLNITMHPRGFTKQHFHWHINGHGCISTRTLFRITQL